MALIASIVDHYTLGGSREAARGLKGEWAPESRSTADTEWPTFRPERRTKTGSPQIPLVGSSWVAAAARPTGWRH